MYFIRCSLKRYAFQDMFLLSREMAASDVTALKAVIDVDKERIMLEKRAEELATCEDDGLNRLKIVIFFAFRQPGEADGHLRTTGGDGLRQGGGESCGNSPRPRFHQNDDVEEVPRLFWLVA
jgi:hypothetical protein